MHEASVGIAIVLGLRTIERILIASGYTFFAFGQNGESSLEGAEELKVLIEAIVNTYTIYVVYKQRPFTKNERALLVTVAGWRLSELAINVYNSSKKGGDEDT